MIQSFTEFYRVLQSVTECCRVLQSVTECYRVLQRVTECYRVLQSITEYCRVLERIAEYCRVLQSIREYYRVLQGITETNLLGPIFGLVYLELCCNFSSSLICHWEGGWIVEEQSSLVFLPHQPSGSESCWGPLRNLFPQETCLDNSPTDGPSARSLIAKRNHLQLD